MKKLLPLLLVPVLATSALAVGQSSSVPDSSALQGAVDMVTAGGWITGTPSGVRANFGLVARDPAAPSGNVNYVDHGDGIHVKSTSITAYTIVNATTRQIEGTASIDGVEGFTFVVVVTDLGEPGTSDTFSISLSNGYSASGTLAGGNVKIHTVL
jgi:hypothetical protein